MTPVNFVARVPVLPLRESQIARVAGTSTRYDDVIFSRHLQLAQNMQEACVCQRCTFSHNTLAVGLVLRAYLSLLA